MNSSAAHLTPGAPVKNPWVTVAPPVFIAAHNDYSSSSYYDLQLESAHRGNHAAAQNHAARTESPHTPLADRFTGGATVDLDPGHPHRSPGSSLKNSAYD